MSIFSLNGLVLNDAYSYLNVSLSNAYDVYGNEIFNNGDEPQPVIEDSEIITNLVESATYNATTYETVRDTNNFVIGPGVLNANYVNLSWNAEECNGFQFKIAVYDQNGDPYMHSNRSIYMGSALTDSMDFFGPYTYPWVNPGDSSNFTAIIGGTFKFRLPTNGTFKLSIRRSGGAGSKVSSNDSFSKWIKDGGLTVTATYEEKEFDFLWLPKTLPNIINKSWAINATAQRNALLEQFKQSEDAIPFFIQTDGHGNYNDGNVGCYNLSEPVMGFIRNLQLGDYGSYYSNGGNAANHIRSSKNLVNYIPVLGNHEFMKNNSSSELADMPTLIESFTAQDGILGSNEIGYYKVVDDDYHVKYLIGQPYIIDENNSSGFVGRDTSDQWEWFISEMEANDGYDIVVLRHAPYSGPIYTWTASGNSAEYGSLAHSWTLLFRARKAKTAGTVTNGNGETFSFDFTGCTSDFLCAFHGHSHAEGYAEASLNSYPVYIATLFDASGNCVYGLIDRANRKLFIYKFNKNGVSDELVLDLDGSQ